MDINIERFLASFKYMGLGMLSIFIVIGVIILSVYALNKLSTSFKQFKEARDKAQAEAQARFDAEQNNQ